MFTLIAFLLSSSIQAQTVVDLCGNTNPQSAMYSPLAKQSKKEWCFGGVCEIDGKTFEREKCVKQIGEDGEVAENHFMVVHKEAHIEPGRSSYKSYGAFYRLYPGDACFSECRPEEKTFLGMTTGKKVGIEKEACVRCMAHLSVKEAETYEVIGHGVTLHKGQLCYGLCRLPAGPYLDHRPYSTECLSCIGVMGIKPIIEHLQNKDGECFEFRDGHYRGVSKVPEKFCKENDPSFTIYKLSSKFSVDSLIFGRPQECYEVDQKSGGSYYKALVSLDKCGTPVSDNSERGNTKTHSPTSSQKKKRGAGATKN